MSITERYYRGRILLEQRRREWEREHGTPKDFHTFAEAELEKAGLDPERYEAEWSVELDPWGEPYDGDGMGRLVTTRHGYYSTDNPPRPDPDAILIDQDRRDATWWVPDDAMRELPAYYSKLGMSRSVAADAYRETCQQAADYLRDCQAYIVEVRIIDTADGTEIASSVIGGIDDVEGYAEEIAREILPEAIDQARVWIDGRCPTCHGTGRKEAR